jgi:hypothetical protein
LWEDVAPLGIYIGRIPKGISSSFDVLTVGLCILQIGLADDSNRRFSIIMFLYVEWMEERFNSPCGIQRMSPPFQN